MDESAESSGADKSDLVSEILGEDKGSVNHDGNNLPGKKKDSKKRNQGRLVLMISVPIVFILTGLALFSLLMGKGKIKEDQESISKKPVGEKLMTSNVDIARTYYELQPFFIPIEGGKKFLRLRISLVDILAGWDKRIRANPHKYRAAVVQVFSGKELKYLKSGVGKQKVKKEIESKFKILSGNGMMGKVVFTSFVFL